MFNRFEILLRVAAGCILTAAYKKTYIQSVPAFQASHVGSIPTARCLTLKIELYRRQNRNLYLPKHHIQMTSHLPSQFLLTHSS